MTQRFPNSGGPSGLPGETGAQLSGSFRPTEWSSISAVFDYFSPYGRDQRRNWRVAPLFERLRFSQLNVRKRPKAKLRVYEPENAVDLEERVDQLLAKVAEHGEASLTPDERAELVAASRRYRDRR